MTDSAQVAIARSVTGSSPSGGHPGSLGAPSSIPAAAISLMLLVADIVGLLAILAITVTMDDMPPDHRRWMIALALLLGLFSAVVFRAAGLYQPKHLVRRQGLLVRLLVAWAAVTGGLWAATMILPSGTGEAAQRWLPYWFAGMVLASAFRLIANVQLRAWQRAGRLGMRVAVVGAGGVAQRLLGMLDPSNPAGPHVVGIYDDNAAGLPAFCLGHRLRGTPDDLIREAHELNVEAVLVTQSTPVDDRFVETLNKLSVLPVDIHVCPADFGLRFRDIRLARVGDVTVLNVLNQPLRQWHWIAKFLEDRLLGLLIVLLIAPLLIAIALLIKLDSPGPVFFRQRRFGYNNRLFEVLKFRTMYHHQRDEKGEQLTRRNDARITPVGRFLRKTSLDELPQFFNVLRGNMSIVGPRPHATAAKAGDVLYQDAVRYYSARHRMKPGITGWAQVNGWRGETETIEQIRQRVEYDLQYIENWSILFDLEIIFRTVLVVAVNRNAF
jgi:Undecaprenyl-phosphate glucose phosphotransferase